MEAKIRAMLESGELSFKDAVPRRKGIPAHSVGKIHLLAIEHANETGEPPAACITKACCIYWRLFEEKKR